MKGLVTALIATGALALALTASIAQAAPAAGVLGNFAPTVQSSTVVDQVHWRRHHHRRHWWWRRHHHHRHYW